MNRTKIFTIFLSGTMGMLPLIYSSNVVANQINTATILTSSASPSCADYKLVGMCYWLYCSAFGCTIRTSVKVHHFIPEMVVSSYNQAGQSPWTEMNLVNQGIKGGRAQSPTKNYSQYRFKNAEAIGHPGGAFLKMINNMGYSCNSQTTPFQPYFLSALDFLAWNHGIPEMLYPEALTPGSREVNANGDLWGNIYPRSGSITQVHDYKAAGVVAQRVADIVSRTGQLHVYFSAAQGDSAGYWPPKAVKEGDKRTHKWQMLSPVMSQSCSIFPDGQAADTYSNKLSEQGNYSWTLWRPYACCKRRGQTFLGSTDWMSY